MAHQHSAKFLKIVDDARSRIRETSVSEVKQRLDRGEKLFLVDGRRCTVIPPRSDRARH